jgi:hypothetical protein
MDEVRLKPSPLIVLDLNRPLPVARLEKSSIGKTCARDNKMEKVDE